MRVVIYAFAIVVLTFAFSCSCKDDLPRLKLQNDTISFGKINLNDSVRLSVKVYNTGLDTLKIINIGYSCDCTNGYLEHKNIPPHDSTVFYVTYKSGKEEGVVHRSIALESNDPGIVTILRVKGEVVVNR